MEAPEVRRRFSEEQLNQPILKLEREDDRQLLVASIQSFAEVWLKDNPDCANAKKIVDGDSLEMTPGQILDFLEEVVPEARRQPGALSNLITVLRKQARLLQISLPE